MDDTITLTGDPECRVEQLSLPRMMDALVALEDDLTDQLAAIDNARQDDVADAEGSGEAERERRSWRLLRAA